MKRGWDPVETLGSFTSQALQWKNLVYLPGTLLCDLPPSKKQGLVTFFQPKVIWPYLGTHLCKPSWWFQPIRKILVTSQIGSFPQVVVKIQNI